MAEVTRPYWIFAMDVNLVTRKAAPQILVVLMRGPIFMALKQPAIQCDYCLINSPKEAPIVADNGVVPFRVLMTLPESPTTK